MNEEEKYKNGLKQLAEGIGFLWWCGVCTMIVQLLMMLEMIQKMNGVLFFELVPSQFVSPYPILEKCVNWVFIPVGMSLWVTFPIGVILCCFCPNRLVKWGRLDLLGSVAAMFASAIVPIVVAFVWFYKDNSAEGLLVCLVMAGLGLSVLLWLFFWLRLATALESVPGKRLAWSVILLFSVPVLGVVAPLSAGYTEGLWWRTPSVTQILAGVAVLVSLGIYTVLLETLRRKVICSS